MAEAFTDEGNSPVAVPDPAGRYLPLGLLTFALVLGISTWFSATAVIPQLAEAWDLSATAQAWLTISVVLGFVIGAVVSSALNIADRVKPQVVMLVGAWGAGLANLGLIWVDDAPVGILLRLLTGVFLAGVYPPSFKLISTWFRRGRGMALGLLAAGIILGNALPHLANALGGVEWQNVIYATSAMSVAGGLVAFFVKDGPFPFPVSAFDPRQVGLVFSNSGVRLASIGLLFDGATWPIVVIGLIWGLTVVADSAQFSAMVTETGDQSYVGTALTMQMAIGFTISAATIWIVPLFEQIVSWRWAFSILAIGPAVGIAAMVRLRGLPEARRIAGGLG